ncbi:Actin family [Tylopilus felleus]
MDTVATVVLDNGGSTIKAGVVGSDETVRIIPNAVVRSKGDKTTYIGHEIARCRDFSSLHYRLPFEKGYLVDWDAQKAVWDGLFSTEVLSVNAPESSLIITEPYFNLPNVQDVYDQFVFEEYEFQSYYRCTPAAMIPYGSLFAAEGLNTPECALIVDSGFSFTHVVPLINHQIQWYAVKRMDVGGKLLTNQLKEVVSYRQWNMMDETFIMNHAKEACCYVSTHFIADLETCRHVVASLHSKQLFNQQRSSPKQNSIVMEYLLPNFSINRGGEIRRLGYELTPTDQVLVMENERFTIPELLYRPDDIGLEQTGLPGTIAASIALLPEDLQGMFWANIGVIGGNTKFSGFHERLMTELRSLAPVDFEINIFKSDDPVTESYRSALAFAKHPDLPSHLLTRAEYLESGSGAVRRKFGHSDTGKLVEKNKSIRQDDIEPRLTKKPSRARLRSSASSTARRR